MYPVRLDLGLFPTGTGEAIARATVVAPADSLSVLTDSAAWVVLRGLWKGRDAPTPSPCGRRYVGAVMATDVSADAGEYRITTPG